MVEKAVTKVIKKRWVPILAPKLFNERVIGESYVAIPETLKGRSVFANLMTLIGDAKRQQINVHFRISEVKEGKGHTTFRALAFSPNSIKRMVRRGRDKVDDSFLCKTQDGVVLRVKPFLITISQVPHGVQTSLRKSFRRKMKEVVSKQNFEQVLRDILEGKLQSLIRSSLNKVTPLKMLDIRVLKVEEIEYTEKETFGPEEVKEEEESEEPMETEEASETPEKNESDV